MPTPRIPLPYALPFTMRDVLHDGGRRGRLRGWLERGEVVQVRPGLFFPAQIADDAVARRTYASRQVCDREKLVSLSVAAELHGLWTPPSLPQFACQPLSLDRVPREYTQERGRLLVPSLPWTALQLGRLAPPPLALIPLDSAARLGASPSDLGGVLKSMYGWRKTQHLASAIARIDAGSESPLESMSRGWMIERRLPKPVLQFRIAVDGNQYYADFAWPDRRLLGEADGLGKYKGPNDVEAEKRRQSRMQSVGYQIHRWTWHDVYPDPSMWLEGLRQALRSR